MGDEAALREIKAAGGIRPPVPLRPCEKLSRVFPRTTDLPSSCLDSLIGRGNVPLCVCTHLFEPGTAIKLLGMTMTLLGGSSLRPVDKILWPLEPDSHQQDDDSKTRA